MCLCDVDAEDRAGGIAIAAPAPRQRTAPLSKRPAAAAKPAVNQSTSVPFVNHFQSCGVLNCLVSTAEHFRWGRKVISMSFSTAHNDQAAAW